MELIGIFSSTLVKWYRNIRLSYINKEMMWSYLSNSSACFQLCSSPIRNSILRYVNCFKALWKIDRIDFFIKHEFISNMKSSLSYSSCCFCSKNDICFIQHLFHLRDSSRSRQSMVTERLLLTMDGTGSWLIYESWFVFLMILVGIFLNWPKPTNYLSQ